MFQTILSVIRHPCLI